MHRKSREGCYAPTGEDCLDGAGSTPVEDHFEWCGGSYSHKDLAEAVAVLHNASCPLDQSTSQTSSHEHEDSSQSAVDYLSEQWNYNLLGHCHSQHTGQAYESYPMHPVFSWPPDAWGMLGREAHTLLTGLLCADHIPWVLCISMPCCVLLCYAALCCAVLCYAAGTCVAYDVAAEAVLLSYNVLCQASAL